MADLFYNQYEFHKACSFIETNPIEAKQLFEEYFTKYPRDYSGMPFYIYTLIVLNQIEEAKAFYSHINQKIHQDSVFLEHLSKYQYALRSMMISKIRILAREKNYLELYHFLEDNPNLLDNHSISFYCKNQLGYIDSKRKYSSYFYNQIVSYQEEDFYHHVERHTADYNRDLDDPNPSIFAPEFPLDEVIKEVKTYIPSENKLCYGMFEDTYVFRYDECGRDHNRLVDYFKVISFNDDESHLITMCPSDHCEELPFIDLNYMRKEEKPKQKVLSQIEKFNRRYRKERGTI